MPVKRAKRRGGVAEPALRPGASGDILYINDLLDQLPAEPAAPTKTIPHGTSAADAAELQRQGFVTVFGG